MKKIYPLVRIKQLIYNPFYIFYYIKRVLFYKKSSFNYEEKYKNIKQLNEVETLKYIIENNKSIIRLNDGEFGLLAGGGIFYGNSWSQKYSKKIKIEIERILLSKNKNYIMALTPIPLIFSKINNELNDKNMHTETRMFAWKYLNENELYGSGSVFMINHHKNINWDLISNYIRNKNIIIVTGNTKSLSNIKLGVNTFFIECGEPHGAFSKIEKIKKRILETINKEKLEKNNSLFMISLGPSAMFITEFLSELNYIAWDTGHIFKNHYKDIEKSLMSK